MSEDPNYEMWLDYQGRYEIETFEKEIQPTQPTVLGIPKTVDIGTTSVDTQTLLIGIAIAGLTGYYIYTNYYSNNPSKPNNPKKKSTIKKLKKELPNVNPKESIKVRTDALKGLSEGQEPGGVKPSDMGVPVETVGVKDGQVKGGV